MNTFDQTQSVTASTASRFVTLQDIADRCHTSRATVSRALRNDVRNTSQATIDHICAVAREMGYDPSRSHAARRLVLGFQGTPLLSQVVALFIPPDFMDDLYYGRMVHGILDVLSAQDFGMLMLYEKSEVLKSLLPIFGRGDVDAAIAIPVFGEFGRVEAHLRKEPNFGQRPIVLLLNEAEGCHAVMVDDFHGGHQAMQHLLNVGHRRILRFTYPTYSYAHTRREAGMQHACSEKGVSPEQVMLSLEWNFDNLDASITSLFALLKEQKVTAIIAPNDRMAVYMHNFFRQWGIRVPEDISLVGFDDVQEIHNRSGENILTTVHVPLLELGMEAANLVLRKLEQHDSSERIETITLSTELIVRSSTAPPSRS